MSSGTASVADARADARIERDIQEIARAVERELGAGLTALLLVGGYARGEGGLVERDGELGPYNDYDLVAVVRGDARSFATGLARVAQAQTIARGVEVDLWPLAERDVGRVPRTLFWLDVGRGAVRVVAGDLGVLDRLARHSPREIPIEEVGRLLANRAVGLALTNLEPEPDRDLRRARHGHKAVLACGDARLLAAHRYPATVAARLSELEGLASAPGVGAALASAYGDAKRFRERPDLWRPTGETVSEWYERTLGRVQEWHLAFESWRVGAPRAPLAAAQWSGRFYPELPDVRPGGAAVSALRAALRLGERMPLLPWVGHPRERLARVAIALAYAPHDPGVRGVAARLLGHRRAPHTDHALHARLGALARLGG